MKKIYSIKRNYIGDDFDGGGDLRTKEGKANRIKWRQLAVLNKTMTTEKKVIDVLHKEKSYCQFRFCPNKGIAFYIEEMIRKNDLLFCSKKCMWSLKYEGHDILTPLI